MYKKTVLTLCMLGFLNLMEADAQAAPVLVTRTSDGVTVKDASGSSAAPAGAFPLLDGQSLNVPEGSTAVVLSSGRAEQLVGPTTFSTSDSVGVSSKSAEDESSG